MRVLRRAVAFDAVAAVWFDPTAALPVDKWIDDSMIDDAGLHLAEIELDAADIDKFRELGASGRRAARLSEATDGKPDGGRGHREPPRPRGVGDELRAVDVGDSGLRGGMVLYRRQGAPHFTARDVNVLASLKGECAEAQRVRLEQDLSADGGDSDRGLLVLDDDDGIEMADAAATAWLDELGAHRPAAPPRRDGGGRTRARDRIRAHRRRRHRHARERGPVDGCSYADRRSATAAGPLASRSRWSRRELRSSPRSSPTPTASPRASGA